MNEPMLPAAGSYIELTSYGETLLDVRVLHAGRGMITLSLPRDETPPQGSAVTVRWAAAPRGRYAVTANVTEVEDNQFDIRFAGDPSVEQARDYVRGGGGELILMERDGEDDAVGFVHDLSERAVRAHFTDVIVRPGDEMVLKVQLTDEVATFAARATKVSSMRQQVPRRGPLSVEMLAVFEGRDDHSAKMVRRYIMKQQLLSRSRAALA
jgi:hypothetical protein